MSNEATERELAKNIDLQASLLQQAYASGTIDNALTRVTMARRMVSNGVFDMIADFEDQNDEPL